MYPHSDSHYTTLEKSYIIHTFESLPVLSKMQVIIFRQINNLKIERNDYAR